MLNKTGMGLAIAFLILILPALSACHSQEKATANGPYQKALFLRGTINNWDTQLPMRYSNGYYLTNVVVAPGRYEFKIADADWQTVDLGAEVDEFMVLGQLHPVKLKGSNLKVNLTTPGTYVFALDARNPETPSAMVQALPVK